MKDRYEGVDLAVLVMNGVAINSPSKLGCFGVFSNAGKCGKLDEERVLGS
jgi:hypothetical protein